MYIEIIKGVSAAAKKKGNYLHHSELQYILASILAGFFVGIGTIMMTLSSTIFFKVPIAFVSFTNGIVFSLGLTFVIFAGGELFTGNVLVSSIGLLNKILSFEKFIKILIYSYIGNFIGAIILSYFFSKTALTDNYLNALSTLVTTKTSYDFMTLVFKGILCNILICIGVASCTRKISDSAKLIMIFWVIFAFVSLGFEQSVANMTLFAVAKFLDPNLSISTIASNLVPVTIGNIIGGGLLAIMYYFLEDKKYRDQRLNKELPDDYEI